MPNVTVAAFLQDVLGSDVPVQFRAYDGSAFGPADADTAVVVRSPDAMRRILTSPDELGFGRAYVAGDIEIDGDMFEVLQMLARFQLAAIGPAPLASALRLVGARGLRPLAPPPEEARLRGTRHSKARRRGGDLLPLRRLEHVLPTRAGPVVHLLLRGVDRYDDEPRGGAGEQARAGVPQTRARAGHAAPRHRLRLGRDGAARGAPLRRPRGRRHPVAPASRARTRARRGRRARRPDRDQGRRLPRRGRWSVRRGELDRDVRARRPHPPGRVLRALPRAGGASRPLPQPRHQPARPHARRHPRSLLQRAARAQFHRALRVPRRRAPRGRQRGERHATRGIRGATRGESARALRPHPAPVGAQPRDELGRGGRARPAPGARGSGASTWPPPPWASRATRSRSTRCSPPAPPTARAGCPSAPTSRSPELRQPPAASRRKRLVRCSGSGSSRGITCSPSSRIVRSASSCSAGPKPNDTWSAPAASHCLHASRA